MRQKTLCINCDMWSECELAKEYCLEADVKINREGYADKKKTKISSVGKDNYEPMESNWKNMLPR